MRAYAQCVGLDADDVFRRFERQFPPDGAGATDPAEPLTAAGRPIVVRPFPHRPAAAESIHARARLLGTAADLTVAMVFAFGCAAAGSRLLWPVLLIACYYAAGVLLTGTSPMVALLAQGRTAAPAKPKEAPAPVPEPTVAVAELPARRPSRHPALLTGDRPVRQRRGMQAPV